MSEVRMRREHAVSAASDAVTLLSLEKWEQAIAKLQEALIVTEQCKVDERRNFQNEKDEIT